MHHNYYSILSLIITAIIHIITAFISFSFLSARRILCTIISFFFDMGVTPWAGNPYYLLFLFHFISSTIFNGPFAERSDVNRHIFFFSTQFVVTWLEIFDNMLFNWAIINFFLIEYYVWAYWISYVLVCLSKQNDF